MIFVPATESLMRRYPGYNYGSLPTLNAYVVMDGEEVLALGGFIRVTRGRRVLFSEVLPETLEKHKLTAVKFAKMLMGVADKNGWTLVADPDENLEGAERFLHYLGFEPDDEGVLTRWPSRSQQ